MNNERQELRGKKLGEDLEEKHLRMGPFAKYVLRKVLKT
jgi:hypothetical protein